MYIQTKKRNLDLQLLRKYTNCLEKTTRPKTIWLLSEYLRRIDRELSKRNIKESGASYYQKVPAFTDIYNMTRKSKGRSHVTSRTESRKLYIEQSKGSFQASINENHHQILLYPQEKSALEEYSIILVKLTCLERLKFLQKIQAGDWTG